MAQSVGTIFAEVDLDFQPYTRAQKRLYQDATSTTMNIEKSYKDLGIRSAREFDLMRAKIANAYDRITKDARSSAADIIRAEKAKADQLKRINDEQFGKQTSLLESARKNWLAYTAVITAGFIAIRSAVRTVGELVEAASDLEEVTSKFNVVFEGQTAQANKWAENLRDNYAMSRREARQYLSSVQDLLVPMGLQAEAAGKLSNEIVKLSADLGSFNNLPTAQVMADVQSALVGNYETMKKYGVVLNETVVKQQVLSQGYADTAKEITAANKAQAAYELIVKGSAAAMGDMARTADSYANQMKKFQSRIEDLKVIFGNAILPVVTDIVTKMNEWIDANEDMIQQDVQTFFKSVADGLGLIYKILKQIETARNVMTKLFMPGHDEWMAQGPTGQGDKPVTGKINSSTPGYYDYKGDFEKGPIPTPAGTGGGAEPPEKTADTMAWTIEDEKAYRDLMIQAATEYDNAILEGMAATDEALKAYKEESAQWEQDFNDQQYTTYLAQLARFEEDKLALVIESENKLKQIKEKSANFQVAIAKGLGSGLLSILGASNQAIFLATQGFDAALAIISGHAAAARALAELGPILGPPVAAKMEMLGYLHAGAIMATAIGNLAMSSVSGATGAGSYTSPTVTTDGDYRADQDGRGTLTFNIYGDISDPDSFVDAFVDKINDAADRDVFINYARSTRAA